MEKRKTLLLLSLAIYIIFFFPVFDWEIKVKAIAALFFIQILWIGRVFTLAFSSLLFILVLSFHFFSYEETLGYLGEEVVWLLFATYIISHAFIKTGLASRLSLTLLKLSKGSGKALILISFILMLVLSVLVPSNIGKGNLVSSVLDRLLKSLREINDVTNLGKSLFIGISYLSAISGAFVATGASNTIYTFGIFTSIYPDLNYLTWLIYFAPPILLFIFILWIIMMSYFPPENVDQRHLVGLLEERLNELGKINLAEKKVIAVMGLTLLLWATQSIHGFSIPLVGLLGAVLTMLPGIGVWEWKEARESINWDMMLFFASTLMVSGMLIKTGTVEWLATVIVETTASQSAILVVIILILCTLIVRIVFVNVLGFLTIMIPLSLNIGENLSGFSPLMVAMAVFLTGVPGFYLITQSPVHLISYSFGYFSDKDLLRVGLPTSLVWVGVICVSLLFFWRIVLG